MPDNPDEWSKFGDADDLQQLYVGYDSDRGDTYLASSELQIEELEEAAEEFNFASRAEAARYFLNLGIRSFVANDPRNRVSSAQDEAITIRELVPKGEDNAVSIRDELLEIISTSQSILG
jgi:hypothetical protein